jgi:hypothetical protein
MKKLTYRIHNFLSKISHQNGTIIYELNIYVKTKASVCKDGKKNLRRQGFGEKKPTKNNHKTLKP